MKAISFWIEALLWLGLGLGYLIGIAYILQELDVTLSAEKKRELAEVGLLWLYGTTGFAATLALCVVWIQRKVTGRSYAE